MHAQGAAMHAVLSSLDGREQQQAQNKGNARGRSWLRNSPIVDTDTQRSTILAR